MSSTMITERSVTSCSMSSVISMAPEDFIPLP
jgi:hypothetical protein